jgi:membrane protein DedA with SNARE-associated domain
MTTELIRFVSWGMLGALLWVTVMVSLIWAYASKGEGEPFRTDMIVRYVLTVFLLFALQIAALAITFLSYLPHWLTDMKMTQHPSSYGVTK